ncbi:MAG TPA: hypothetical protein VEG27_10695 [Usitatibacter sp.]|nr:hypothetical protein [Usitatibacter sp.]
MARQLGDGGSLAEAEGFRRRQEEKRGAERRVPPAPRAQDPARFGDHGLPRDDPERFLRALYHGGLDANQYRPASRAENGRELRYGALAIRIRQLDATGADRSLTGCADCRQSSDDGIAHAGAGCKVGSLVELVAGELA